MTLEKTSTTSPSHAVRDVIAPELPERARWHVLLLLVAAAMGVTAVITTLLVFIDPIQITGQNGWYKPLKFAISISVYSVSLSWLIGLLRRGRRAAEIAGTVSAIALLIEMVIIVGAAAVGTTSHFNVSTPLHIVMLTVMAVSTVVIWAMALVVAIAVIFNPGKDAARNLTVRAATLVGLIGMGLGSLMVFPTPQQLDGGGVIGAHAVGVPDGGAGLPVLGWSTIGGDLRIPHFVGMHALQLLPMLLLALELAARRVPVLRDGILRLRLMWIATIALSAAVALLTWQALIGQSIVAPAGPILVTGCAVLLGTVGAVVVSVHLARRTLSVPVPQPASLA